MSPEQTALRTGLYARIHALITRCAHGARDDVARDALLLDLAAYQRAYVAPYGRFASQRLARGSGVDAITPLPTDAFRFTRISSRDASAGERVFESSGTTSAERSRHALSDLTLYDLAAETAARALLFPDLQRMRLLIVAPTGADMPSSSLSYMLSRFVAWFGSARSEHVFPVDGAHVEELVAALRGEQQPVALLGTSFAFLHALDALADRPLPLPAGSRIMQTGGFKGKSREIAPAEMRRWLSLKFAVPEPMIVAEYGMTELSSQLYESTLRDALAQREGARRLIAPGWVRALVVHPETLLPVPDGERGLVRIDDLANLDSVAAIQTADLGRVVEGGLVLEGRAAGAVARGCSITADELLARGRG